MSDSPTVVFGLDGAGFELIRPWIEAGELPNIERAVETGISGDLQSVMPPVTSPNWKAYATGKNPGKIGIYWWENVDVDERRVYYPTERKGENTEYWELIAEKDGAGVLGVPTTYPPKSINGFVVAGAPDGANEGFARPPELERRLQEEFDYRVLKRTRLADDMDAAAKEIHDLIDLRFTVAKQLFAEYDISFLQVTTFYLNSLHHFLWDHEYTLEGWRIVDAHLGEFLDRDINVVLMSDHGSNEVRTVFHINSWLEREGYLTTDTGVADTLHDLGINADRLLRLASRAGLDGVARRLAPEWLLNYIPNEAGEIERGGKAGSVDWDATEALASGQGPIYLTVDRDSARYERLRTELIEKLGSLTDPRGRPVLAAVHRGEDIYDGPYIDDAPDLVMEQAAGVHIPGSVGRDEVFSDPRADGWRAENKREGLFVATGPDFTTGRIEGLSILDLAPTLLHLHGCPVPEDMDGTVRSEVFAPGSEPAERAVVGQSGTTDSERERIRRVARRLDI
jgi:predicted AlkP superfamily phosphohydrolase/phosphomutase